MEPWKIYADKGNVILCLMILQQPLDITMNGFNDITQRIFPEGFWFMKILHKL